jgi:hypothetical protein
VYRPFLYGDVRERSEAALAYRQLEHCEKRFAFGCVKQSKIRLSVWNFRSGNE